MSCTAFRVGRDACSEGSISYDTALKRLNAVAETAVGSQKHLRSESCQSTPHEPQWIESTEQASALLVDAVGRRCARTVYAPYHTPLSDTSAMDGYVVNASLTAEASKADPLRLRIVGSIAAGDAPGDLTHHEESVEQGHICAEIMTGACFPHALPYLDSVVKVEDVSVEHDSSECCLGSYSYIVLTEPVKNYQHRRLAGSDFAKGDVIIEDGTIIQPKHVAALASLGFTNVEVSMAPARTKSAETAPTSRPGLRVGFLSTGSEIVSGLDETSDATRPNSTSKQVIPDSNGPYIVSNLRATFPTVSIEHLGIVKDDENELVSRLRGSIFEDDFDVVITSGGVSKGRYDLVRYVIEEKLNGRIIFHGVKIRPGAPILFASFDHGDEATDEARRRRTVFFGVPGNPLAAAVACRFFIVPYILGTSEVNLGRMKQELQLSQRTKDGKGIVSLHRKLHEKELGGVKPIRTKPLHSTVFWLAQQQSETFESVVLIDDQASYKLKGLLEADCWVTVPSGSSDVRPGDLLLASPL